MTRKPNQTEFMSSVLAACVVLSLTTVASAATPETLLVQIGRAHV